MPHSLCIKCRFSPGTTREGIRGYVCCRPRINGLYDKIKQHCGLFLDARIEFIFVKSLIYDADRAFKRFVFFVAEKFAAAEFVAQFPDGQHS